MVGDTVRVKTEDLSNKAMLGTFEMHANNQKLGLVFIGGFRVIKSFRNVAKVLIREFEADHLGRRW